MTSRPLEPVDAASAVPPFEQVRVQIRDRVQSGELAAGTKLPTVRGLAEELGVAAGTVARAYRELEAESIIETRGRAGSFIAAQGDPSERLAQEAASVYARRVRQLGVSPDTALAYVTAALRS